MNLKFLRLPGSYNFPSTMRNAIPVKAVENHLGISIYPRICSIYINIIEAIANKKYAYLSSAMSSALSMHLISKINELKQNGYRLKVQRPDRVVHSKQSLLSKRTVYSQENIEVSLNCKVYFGLKFHPELPVVNEDPMIKIFHTGTNRYFVYDRNQTIISNIKGWYNYQTFEFIVKVNSSTYMEILDATGKTLKVEQESINSGLKQDGLQKVETEMVMRTGNTSFDWVVIDVNGLMKSRSKI